MEQNNPFIVVTTYNHLGITRKCMEYLQDLPYGILVIDDNSKDGTQEYLSQIRVSAYCKEKRKGLTDSWNWAYKQFKSSNYSHLILMNNDVLVPKMCIENMLSDYTLVVPMTTFEGAGYMAKDQCIDYHVDLFGIDSIKAYNTQKVQDKLVRSFKPVRSWTGFMMCLSRDIEQYEREDGNLFDPANVNVGNDDDLAKRVQAYLALGSYVYHYKGISFEGKIAGRDKI